MGIIANFGIRFGVDTSDVDAGVTKLKGALGGIGSNLAVVGAAIAQSIDFSAVGAAAQKAVDTASRIADMAQRVGITAEAVQRLQFAAEQSGGSFEAVATAMRVMSDRIVDGKLPQALQDMGLSLQGLSMDEAFLRAADAIASIEDPMLRSATAVDIFGRGAQALMPAILNGFRDVADQAPIMSNALVGAADDVGDRWAELQLRMENLKAEALIPVVDLMMKLPASVQLMGSAFSNALPFVANFGIAAAMLPTALANLTTLIPSLAGLGAALAGIAAPLALFGAAVVGVKALADALRELTTEAERSQILNDMRSGGNSGNIQQMLQRTGWAEKPRQGPKPFIGPRMDAGVVKGEGIGALLEAEVPGIKKNTQATNELAAARQRLNREVEALTSWARNEQGMHMWNMDVAAIKRTTELMKVATKAMPSTGGMTSQDASALPSSMNNIGAAMRGIPAAIQSQGASQMVTAGMTLGEQLKVGMAGSFATLPMTILKAFQGGGNPMSSIFSSLGGTLGTNLSTSIGKALSGTLGKTMGSAIGGLMGPLFAMLGPLIGDLATKLGKKIWQGLQGVFGTDEEARDVNPARDAFLAKFGGAGTGEGSGFATLAAKLTELTGEAGGGAAFAGLTSADTMAEFTAAVQRIEELLAPVAAAAATAVTGTETAVAGAAGVAPVAAPNITINIETVIGEEQWVRDKVLGPLMAAIQGNANGSFSQFQALVNQSLPPTPVVPGLP